jgi:hypothetical protein
MAAFGYACAAGDPTESVEPVESEPSESVAGAGEDGVACGDNRCQADEVCCSEACGVCAKPGAVCITKGCNPQPECSSDAHCAVASDTCATCACHALSLNAEEQLPACSGDGVQCFVDPCLNRHAVCQSGQCVVE